MHIDAESTPVGLLIVQFILIGERWVRIDVIDQEIDRCRRRRARGALWDII